MHLLLKTQLAGKLAFKAVPGTMITTGKILAEVEPEGAFVWRSSQPHSASLWIGGVFYFNYGFMAAR